jgi:hypothetical protein
MMFNWYNDTNEGNFFIEGLKYNNEVVNFWWRQEVDEGLDVATWCSTCLDCNDFGIQKHNFSICISFTMKANQMFMAWNDFVAAIHNLHHLKCDLVLKCLLMCF